MAQTVQCAVCDTPNPQIRLFPNRDALIVDCNRCGRFAMSGTMSAIMEQAPKKDRMRLSSLIKERELLGQLPLALMSETPGTPGGFSKEGFHAVGWKDYVEQEFPRSISEKFDRSLRNLSRRAEPGKWISQASNDEAMYYAEDDDVYEFITETLRGDGLIDRQRSGPQSPVRLTARGWNRIAEIERGVAALKYRQAFVAMWFDTSMDAAWQNGFKPGIETETSIKAVRVDLQEHNEKICDVIVAEIRKSSFLVADFTGGRGGVYFEAGFAKGLGLPVIFTCQRGEWPEKLHFDTRQYNHIIWDSPSDLAAKLKSRIAATIVPARPDRNADSN